MKRIKSDQVGAFAWALHLRVMLNEYRTFARDIFGPKAKILEVKVDGEWDNGPIQWIHSITAREDKASPPLPYDLTTEWWQKQLKDHKIQPEVSVAGALSDADDWSLEVKELYNSREEELPVDPFFDIIHLDKDEDFTIPEVFVKGSGWPT